MNNDKCCSLLGAAFGPLDFCLREFPEARFDEKKTVGSKNKLIHNIFTHIGLISHVSQCTGLTFKLKNKHADTH